MANESALRTTPVTDYQLEDQIGYLLRRAHQRATAIFVERMAAAELTPTQWAVLFKLGEVGEISQNSLGRLVAMDFATLQGVVKRLTQRKLIVRTRDPHDGRRLVLRLTEDGEAIVAESIGIGHGISRETLGPLSPHERETLIKLLRRIV